MKLLAIIILAFACVACSGGSSSSSSPDPAPAPTLPSEPDYSGIDTWDIVSWTIVQEHASAPELLTVEIDVYKNPSWEVSGVSLTLSHTKTDGQVSESGRWLEFVDGLHTYQLTSVNTDNHVKFEVTWSTETTTLWEQGDEYVPVSDG